MHPNQPPTGPDAQPKGNAPRESDLALGRPELLREVNARHLLRLLRLYGPCSRADLVRRSGLSAPTVSSAVAFLQDHGLVESIGPGRSNGGRRPSLLRFNHGLGYVAGVDIGRSVIRVALADLRGNIIERWVTDCPAKLSPEEVVRRVASGIRELERRHGVPPGKILAASAGVPGITNPVAGIVISVPNFSPRWDDVPLRALLEKACHITTSVENDVNLAALGESWCGIAQGVKDFVFLSIGTGVGAGIFVNGQLYHGAEWTAGEIAYLYVPGTEESPLALRRRGPLESVIGSDGIEQFWLTLGARKQGGKNRVPRLGAAEVFDLAARGGAVALDVLQQTARILADAITNVCVILNSSLVVLGGRIGTHPALYEAVDRILERNEFSRPRLAVSSLGREAQLFGAIWLALNVADTKILPTVDGRNRDVSSRRSRFALPVLGLVPPN